MTTTAVDKIKVWIFPTLVTVIGFFIWQEINEIKSDVKALLAQSNIDKTRIDNLERIIYTKPVSKNTKKNQKEPSDTLFFLTEFVLPSRDWDDEEA